LLRKQTPDTQLTPPICQAAARREKTKEEVERNIQQAIEFHIEGLKEEGYAVPEPSTYSSYVDVAA
jgi:predicted RNase H-like HicB family nuclease